MSISWIKDVMKNILYIIIVFALLQMIVISKSLAQPVSNFAMVEYLSNPNTVKDFAHLAHSSYSIDDFTVAQIDNNTVRYRITYGVLVVRSITCAYDIHFKYDSSLGFCKVSRISVVTEGSIKKSFRTYLWLNDDKFAKYYYTYWFKKFNLTWEELSDIDKVAILLTINYMK